MALTATCRRRNDQCLPDVWAVSGFFVRRLGNFEPSRITLSRPEAILLCVVIAGSRGKIMRRRTRLRLNRLFSSISNPRRRCVYQHVLAWREAGILWNSTLCFADPPSHGNEGRVFMTALLRETGRAVTQEQIQELQENHAQAHARQLSTVRPLPGAENCWIS